MATIDDGFEFEIEDRVHIMPIGYEEERAYLAAEALKADKVILIGHENDSDKGRECVNNISESLSEIGVKHDIEHCDIFNLYDALGMIAEMVDTFTDEDVYVNVSTGGKITAIAGMIACMVTGATPYYVQAENYGVTPPEGIAQITKLPHYPIDAPDAQRIEILNYIRERITEGDPPTKGELIEYGEDVGLPFVSDYQVEEKSKYRLLDNQIIDPLISDGYVTVKKLGREKVVDITEDGENTLNAFRYLIENGFEKS